MIDKYSITVIKDKQCVKYFTSNDLDLILDYFKIYNTPDYRISIMDLITSELMATKVGGICL